MMTVINYMGELDEFFEVIMNFCNNLDHTITTLKKKYWTGKG